MPLNRVNINSWISEGHLACGMCICNDQSVEKVLFLKLAAVQGFPDFIGKPLNLPTVTELFRLECQVCFQVFAFTTMQVLYG